MLSDCLLIRSDGVRFRLMGADTFSEDPGQKMDTIYYRGTPQRVVRQTNDRTCSLVVYDSPIDKSTKHMVTLAFETSTRGKRTLVVYPKCRFEIDRDPHKTVSDSVEPEKTTINFFPLDVKFRRFRTPVVEIREHLVGTEAYQVLKETLYRQNGSYSALHDLIVEGKITSRKFRVVYNQDGAWEVSGPAELIREEAGKWEVDNIRFFETNGTFEMFDDYEEDTLWPL